MRIYAAKPKYPPSDTRFYFHAQDQEDADDKIFGWNRYHSFSDAPGWGWHIAEEVPEAPADWMHDEWMIH